MHDENFEQWVRTSKVFLVDYYESNPALHPGSGASVEATMATLTTLPWQEAKSFRVGSIIQSYPPIRERMKFPNFEAIEAALSGRTRCALEFSNGFDPEASIFAGSEQTAIRYGVPFGCPGTDGQFLPTAWASSPYVPPHGTLRLVTHENTRAGCLREAVCILRGAESARVGRERLFPKHGETDTRHPPVHTDDRPRRRV